MSNRSRMSLSRYVALLLIGGTCQSVWGQQSGYYIDSPVVIASQASFTDAGASSQDGKVADDLAKILEKIEASEARIKELEESLKKGSSKDKESSDKKEEKKEEKKEDKKEDKKDEKKEDKKEEKKEKKWFEKYTIRGYTQVRSNQELFEDEPSAPAQLVGDRSVSEDHSFFVRRARLILSGDMNDHAALYFQPDFAITTPGSPDQTHFVQIRDLYTDLFLDSDREYRFRVGQSKIPYGWENMQSSSNRVPLDRADSLNSAARNERDLGVFFYWTPKSAQDFFKDVIDEGLKGSGNYGVFALGAYNGQGGSFLETNDNMHVISRLTYPMHFQNGQRAEAAVQGYIGEYTVLSSGIRPRGAGNGSFRPAGTLETGNPQGWNDRRIATTWVWYPQPFGFQTEWTVGRGPTLNAAQTAIEDQALYGGYAMFLLKHENCYGKWYPFVRWSYYRGGYKSERNAPYTEIDEWEFGNEWQIHPAAELTLSYLITDRTNTLASTPSGTAPYQQFDGHILRAQFQFNY